MSKTIWFGSIAMRKDTHAFHKDYSNAATLSFCLRDSADALHLRHSKLSFSRASSVIQSHPQWIPESITPSVSRMATFLKNFAGFIKLFLLYAMYHQKAIGIFHKIGNMTEVFLHKSDKTNQFSQKG